MKANRVLQLLAITLPLALLSLMLQSVQAVAPDGIWGDPHIGVVVDTTATMQQELDALASAVNAAQLEPGIFHLAAFKDEALYLGNTDSLPEFRNWIESLNAGGGSLCPDNALGGLRAMALNLPDSKRPASEVLLLTDATPIGNRQVYAFIVDKLLQRGVRVHSVLSGWCTGAPLPMAALFYVTQATGGEWFSPTVSTVYTDTLIALEITAKQDTVLAYNDSVSPEFPDSITIPLDSTITTLGVDDHYWKYSHCLTCTQPIPLPNVTIAAGNGVQVSLVDPAGNVIGPGTPGYSSLTGTQHRWQALNETGPIYPGAWELHITGEGGYYVNVMVDSTLHMANLGRHAYPAGRPVPLRALLVNEDVGTGSDITGASFRLITLDGQLAFPIDLFDDGQHGDGAPGDGIYGGLVIPPSPGRYRLAVQGELGDGSIFRRVDRAPIRFQRHQLLDPPGRVTLPDSTVMSTFRLSNEDDSLRGGTTTFDLLLSSSQGWAITGTVPASVTLAPGESVSFDVETVVPAGSPVGLVEEVALTVAPVGNIGEASTAFVEITVVDQIPLYLPFAIKP
jgi:hypothetical protein